ncbi:hypothetical protein KGQ20_42795 [Catenulispora sp. NF23]|uniref:hypothetical protein n=1 Tax=Catenulispora pinistramenti TaxID=2705254 RepID=UPI001BA63219|nr:hypothetical protein [Catenulispora pinistramenti]MBS2539492.1 hypothetical protein [Catenulispora pinistramenti]
MTADAADAAPAADPDDTDTGTALISGALRSRDDDPAPWTVAWGMLPPGVETVRVTFRDGRRTEPAARVGVLGRHWAAEVAGRFDKVQVTGGTVRESAKVRTREKTPTPGRFSRKRNVLPPSDPLERMKHHWGLAAVILQPGSEDRPVLPDIRSAGGDMA